MPTKMNFLPKSGNIFGTWFAYNCMNNNFMKNNILNMSELKLPHKLEQSNTSSNITSKKGFVNKFFGSDGFNFKDVLDLINPLHHIPIVGAVYRSLSNDKIAPAIKLAGCLLYTSPSPRD